jgi:hypothetical protein
VVDVVGGDVDGHVLEALGAVQIREVADAPAGRIQDGVAAPGRGRRDLHGVESRR